MAGVLALGMGHGTALSQTNDGADLSRVSRTEQMQLMRQAVNAAEAAYMTAGRQAENSDQTERVWNYYRNLNLTNLPRIFSLAAQDPASVPSFDMFVWVATNRFYQSPLLATNCLQALEYLRDYQATNPNLAGVCRHLGRSWNNNFQPALDLLRSVAQKNPNPDVRGQAALAVARLEKDQADDLVYFKNAPPGDARFEKLRTNYLAAAGNENAAARAAEAQHWLQVVLDQYADVPSLDPTNGWQARATLGEAARAKLFELMHLSLGSPAPEIEGEDLAGRPLRLSDYRGKVVVLSFWASWCGPCMQMVPSEVRLAELMRGKPFALMGVNGDARWTNALQAVAKNNISWPSFCSNKGPDGPIPTAWNVSGWPTVFVLDPKGVIRFKFTGYGGTNTEKILTEEIEQILNQWPAKPRT